RWRRGPATTSSRWGRWGSGGRRGDPPAPAPDRLRRPGAPLLPERGEGENSPAPGEQTPLAPWGRGVGEPDGSPGVRGAALSMVGKTPAVTKVSEQQKEGGICSTCPT